MKELELHTLVVYLSIYFGCRRVSVCVLDKLCGCGLSVFVHVLLL